MIATITPKRRARLIRHAAAATVSTRTANERANANLIIQLGLGFQEDIHLKNSNHKQYVAYIRSFISNISRDTIREKVRIWTNIHSQLKTNQKTCAFIQNMFRATGGKYSSSALSIASCLRLGGNGQAIISIARSVDGFNEFVIRTRNLPRLRQSMSTAMRQARVRTFTNGRGVLPVRFGKRASGGFIKMVNRLSPEMGFPTNVYELTPDQRGEILWQAVKLYNASNS